MRVVIQRVKNGSVKVENKITGSIGVGLLILVGIEEADTKEDIEWLCSKIARLRIFPDSADVMNLSVTDIDGDILVVSQFTLHAATKKGNRPSYIKAAPPQIAIPLYEQFVERLEYEIGEKVQGGVFGAMMDVSLVNWGPVTIWIDTKSKE
ncbi:MAG TPA: D-aminoacyl-tRNA deacylase [Bacteroidales bacterium]|nr:D-aminoacyl-tRNA deacylase [Bacteroidales bacterium]HPS72544.1 D-aminoacyl-tRNA deacylase [Bacteroidales bacterium]